ncbi:hypothetical protein NDU88_006891 [Pleurodeles waltl]|uniref:Uncharacterized protein n=1 Tax=Pleurodeles waltl TaxID=8319 RepID=A0AAV7NRJ9_PLEWA|nr:hypothetical protein NDU88_006891 [Pleurodeles waltl]
MITCVHGDQRLYPVAMVCLNWRGTDETITVGMIPNLGEDLILGTDYVDFAPLLEKACQEHTTNTWWGEALFVTTKIEARPLRKKLSRKRKREQRLEYQNPQSHEITKTISQTATVLTIGGDFRQAQREDPTLKNAWQQVLHPDGRSTVWEEAHSALREAQNKQKRIYDAKSTLRSLRVRDKVLVLLPSCENKLIARWQGPYEGIEQINPTTYKLAITPGTVRELIYHINLLKKWCESMDEHPTLYIAKEQEEDIPLHPLPTNPQAPSPTPHVNTALSESKLNQLNTLVKDNLDVFSKIPGRTSLVQHSIRTNVNTVSQQCPYQIPEAKNEL